MNTEPQTDPAGRKRDYTTAAILAVIGLVLVVIVLLPAVGGKGPPPPAGWNRRFELRTLPTILDDYAFEHESALPPMGNWLEVLADEYGLNENETLAPNLIGDHYFLLPPPTPDGTYPPNLTRSELGKTSLMLYEHPSLWKNRTNVAFWNMEVEQVNDAELERLLSESDARLGYRYRPHEGVTP
ncbi:MAG: hypothetical protein RIB60_01200 [Phycisphaerales bacterium]